MIELNHLGEFDSEYVNSDGELVPAKLKKIVTSQYIFWRWNDEYRRYDVCGFLVVNPRNEAKPSVVKRGPLYRFTWNGWRQKVVVEAKLYKESTTGYDPERSNMKLLPERFREKINGTQFLW